MSKPNDSFLTRVWYGDSALYRLFLPLAWLFAAAVACRRFLYARGVFQAYAVDAPVIVIGNVTAGGTGKTPVVGWLAAALENRGHKPVIVSRGYRGRVGALPVTVDAASDPAEVGDEAVMLAIQCGCPVVVHPERVAAARKAVELGADVIIADDGLQHYRLGRNLEIAVVDGERGFGNGSLLPAGPLREPASRLYSVDKVILQQHPEAESRVLRRASDRRPLSFSLVASAICRLDGSDVRRLDEFAGRALHAVAGIGHPERFFRLLESHGMRITRHPMPDHAAFTRDDLQFGDDLDVVMTAKDAVKCRHLDTTDGWYVPVEVRFEAGDGDILVQLAEDTIREWRAGRPD